VRPTLRLLRPPRAAATSTPVPLLTPLRLRYDCWEKHKEVVHPDAFHGIQVEGPLADSVDGLSHTTKIDLRKNGLAGTFPDAFGAELPMLTELWLGGNGLSGKLPSDFGKLSILRFLDLGECKLSGRFHEHVSPLLEPLVLLELVYLECNYFAGHIPEELFEALVRGGDAAALLPAALLPAARLLRLPRHYYYSYSSYY